MPFDLPVIKIYSEKPRYFEVVSILVKLISDFNWLCGAGLIDIKYYRGTKSYFLL